MYFRGGMNMSVSIIFYMRCTCACSTGYNCIFTLNMQTGNIFMDFFFRFLSTSPCIAGCASITLSTTYVTSIHYKLEKENEKWKARTRISCENSV